MLLPWKRFGPLSTYASLRSMSSLVGTFGTHSTSLSNNKFGPVSMYTSFLILVCWWELIKSSLLDTKSTFSHFGTRPLYFHLSTCFLQTDEIKKELSHQGRQIVQVQIHIGVSPICFGCLFYNLVGGNFLLIALLVAFALLSGGYRVLLGLAWIVIPLPFHFFYNTSPSPLPLFS